MPRFRHQSLDAAGATVSGALDATDRRDALRQLRGRGLNPLHVGPDGDAPPAATDGERPRDDTPDLGRRPWLGTHPAALRFFGKLEQLTAGGLPAGDAVRLLAARTGEPALKTLSAALWRDLSEGRTLAEALRRFPDAFDTGACGLIEAGEATGTLGPALRRIIALQTAREELRQRLIAALAYPALVCGLAGVTIALFVFHLLPRLEAMMHALNSGFSGAPGLLIALARGAVYGAPALLALAAVFAVRIHRERATPEGRRRSDALLLRLPLAGPIVRHADISGLSGLLGTLLGSGVNATDALRLAEKAVGNGVIREKFADARTRINEGSTFSAALRRHGLLDEAELDILLVNESTGTLPRAFEEISRGRMTALDAALRRLVTTLSAVFLITAFTIVFFCLTAVMLSVLQVSRSILG